MIYSLFHHWLILTKNSVFSVNWYSKHPLFIYWGFYQICALFHYNYFGSKYWAFYCVLAFTIPNDWSIIYVCIYIYIYYVLIHIYTNEDIWCKSLIPFLLLSYDKETRKWICMHGQHPTWFLLVYPYTCINQKKYIFITIYFISKIWNTFSVQI